MSKNRNVSICSKRKQTPWMWVFQQSPRWMGQGRCSVDRHLPAPNHMAYSVKWLIRLQEPSHGLTQWEIGWNRRAEDRTIASACLWDSWPSAALNAAVMEEDSRGAANFDKIRDSNGIYRGLSKQCWSGEGGFWERVELRRVATMRPPHAHALFYFLLCAHSFIRSVMVS